MESYVVVLSLSVVLYLSQYISLYHFYTLTFVSQSKYKFSQNTKSKYSYFQLVLVSFEFEVTQDIVGKVRLVVTSKHNPI